MNAVMTGKAALESYGYTFNPDTGFYTNTQSGQVWQENEGGGWLCFNRATPTFKSPSVSDPAKGEPWGKPVAGVPGWVVTPYGLAEGWDGVGGLHPLTHEVAFQWVWPDEAVAEIYEFASREESNPYIRGEDGVLTLA